MSPHETLERLKTRLSQAGHLSEESRAKLLGLIAELDTELSALEPGGRPDPSLHSALTLADAAALERAREDQNRDILHQILAALNASVTELEIRHPRIAQALAGIGRAF